MKTPRSLIRRRRAQRLARQARHAWFATLTPEEQAKMKHGRSLYVNYGCKCSTCRADNRDHRSGRAIPTGRRV